MKIIEESFGFKMRRSFVFCMFMVLFGLSARAEVTPFCPSIVNRYYFENDKYVVEVDGGATPRSQNEVSFFAEGGMNWQVMANSMPRFVRVSSDGQYVVFVNQSGGNSYTSISFYKGSGELIKEYNLEADKINLLESVTLSTDGKFLFLGEFVASNEKYKIRKFDVSQGVLLWEKGLGFGSFEKLLMSKDAKSFLLATYDIKMISDNDGSHNDVWRGHFGSKSVVFTYFNGAGDVLWERSIKNVLERKPSRMELSDDGLMFRIYDVLADKWIEYVNRNGKVE